MLKKTFSLPRQRTFKKVLLPIVGICLFIFASGCGKVSKEENEPDLSTSKSFGVFADLSAEGGHGQVLTTPSFRISAVKAGKLNAQGTILQSASFKVKGGISAAF